MQKSRLDGKKCETCNKGRYRTTPTKNYRTKVRGFPVVVPEATLVICDHCGDAYPDRKERQRIEALFDQQFADREALPSGEEIRALREEMGLALADFALFIGTTRNSLADYESGKRTLAASRSTALMLRALRRSMEKGPVDVLDFLEEEGRKWGLELEIRKPLRA